ncbi:hypothetical protein GYN24_06475 [Lactococcus piscium]|uniref:hypothetical protein n=1 Tax=Pseudolactococcus paracarnosus TaxID=2749962 RepID=UPI000D47FCBC|nr:hypothetical protein [Lactococcus paracarnosus]MCJ1994223.1 hypothetical protein [Lactococcus paracarnosus]SPC35118.1 conserved hypothetical protein [Lactococcus piscium]
MFEYIKTKNYKLPEYGFKVHISATSSYEIDFLKGYEGYKLIKRMREDLWH